MRSIPVPRFLKSFFPVIIREKLRIYEHNFLKVPLRKDFSALRVTRQGNYWFVDDGRNSILVPDIQRWRQYRYGLERRYRNVADKYGLGRYYDLDPNDLIIDIGANIGEFSIMAHKLGAIVYSIEADDVVFENLKKNTDQAQRISCFNEIIWSKNETVTFYSSTAGADSSAIRPDRFTSYCKKKAITLDKFMSKNRIDRVKLIKCDAEGAEPEVLNGAEKILRITEWVAFDCGPERHGASTINFAREFLIRNGFSICSDSDINNVRLGRIIAKNNQLS